MPVLISVTTDFDKLAETLDDFAKRQLPFATARALTKTAQAAKADVVAEMKRVFDRPTPWTLNSVFVQSATKASLAADVHFKDFAPKGVPAGRYLAPQILGGGRVSKAGERRLGAALELKAPFLVPTQHMELDGFGNVSKAQIVTILARLGALPGASTVRRSRRRRRAQGYFAITPGGRQGLGGRGGGLPPGIYRTLSSGLGRSVVPVMTFTRKPPHYAPRFDFDGVVLRAYGRYFPAWLDQALQEAIDRARP